MTLILSIIFFTSLLFVAGKRGLKTFFTFYLSFLLIVLYLVFITFNFDAIILSIICCLLSTVVSLFLLNGYNVKTKSSFISIMIVLVFIFLLTFFISKSANIQGYGIETIEEVGAYSHEINYDMTKVIIGVYLISIIGTVIDTSISISSAMNEVYENNLKITKNDLFISGMNIGKDILSTTINTLFFALISVFIGFFMWHRSSVIISLINNKVFTQHIIQLLISFIGSILIIPITAYISSTIILKDNKK